MNPPSPPVTTRQSGPVCLIEIDNPPVNASSQPVRAQIAAALETANADPAVHSIVILCKGRTFVAGADITEFGKPPLSPALGAVCNLIEASGKPVIAAIHGTALGGGCEIALACHGRVARADAQLGLPEVKLGLVPGAGGTQRLPRLVGIETALALVSSGRMVNADEALRIGLVDAVATEDLETAAVALAGRMAGESLRRVSNLPVPAFDPEAVEARVREIERRARGQVSPGRAARTVLAAASLPFAEGLALERATFTELVATEQSAALRHVFFAERAAAKIPQIAGVAPHDIRCVGVAGAGTMGSGIAAALAEAGYRVIVVERGVEAASAGLGRITAIHRRALEASRITEAQCDERLGATRVGTELSDFAPCDLVIEAVFDDLAVKQDLFAALSAIIRPDAILATNTSYLDPEAIGSAATHPERVVGMHFFSPANIMRLMEIVPTSRTALAVLATAFAVGKRLKKLCVLAGNCEGFIGNRIFATYRKQCEFMVEDGALPHEVDAAMEAFGLPMGPFAVFDLAGLDIAWARRKRQAASRDPAERYVRIADKLCELGRFGQKTGAGWYVYDQGKRRPDAGVTSIIEAEAAISGIARRPIGADEIRRRIIAAMVNEGARLLEDGIAQRASDIDLVFVNGYGWPAWRGGPMFQADRMGIDVILAEVRLMQSRDGAGWEPARRLIDMASTGARFGDA
ncbi:MAG: 3-hydroxyacyl-CoA dehydrogenase NAD-binding domain-containing protein [Hyphomicrobiales bacterium]|nr:3-hydroxyacyl-CoA dehydrogenase NAD-binding domain-containing protein [Hyphomicrobiales bacterium]